jgi:2-dehydro-3-deoxy-D-arabinonate dehydratase
MKLYRTAEALVVEADDQFYLTTHTDWDTFVNQPDLHAAMQATIAELEPMGGTEWLATQHLLAPLGTQEIWAAGVTYLRSKAARMEESKEAGGGTFYDKVYDAERPEIFFKATPHRTVGPGYPVRIRQDSDWNVPEPELTLFVNTSGAIAGYTVGNDMSSRSIEGENPLYLPQAKSYDGSAAIGPCLYVPSEPLPAETIITLHIFRADETVFSGSIALNQMKRTPDELVAYLLRECSFPQGCYLMTGTGIVPDPDFTLQSGDEIRISIEPIGTLVNTVA